MEHLYSSKLSKEIYDVIIIGSGLGGLTTASILAKEGKKVLILERHYEPGGFTHTFKRKKFEWDVGVHYIGQVADEKSTTRKAFDYITSNKLKWTSMGDVYDKIIIGNDHYDYLTGKENQIKNLIGHFPEEKEAIEKYFALLEKNGVLNSMYFGFRSAPPFIGKILNFLFNKGFYKYSDKTTYEVLKDLTHNEKLICVLAGQCGNYGLMPKKSSFAIHATVASHYIDGGSYPIGGAAAIHENIIDEIEKSGGIIALKAEVNKILTDGKKAIGVEMKNGDKIYAKVIVSNAGAKNTFNKLLPDRNHLPVGMTRELDEVKPSVSHLALYIGLNKSDEELNLPKCNYWLYNSYNFDEDFNNFYDDNSSPLPLAYVSFPSAKDPEWPLKHKNMSTIQVLMPCKFEWVSEWENETWMKRGDQYNELKEKFKNILLEKLYEVVPQIKGHIEICEVSTPLSTKHFSNYSSGEMYGLEHSPERFRMKYIRPHTPIKNLFLTGQDIVTVGVAGALFSGLLTSVAVMHKNLYSKVMSYKPE